MIKINDIAITGSQIFGVTIKSILNIEDSHFSAGLN